MSKMKELAGLGQSVWLDFIRRAFLEAGELEKLVAQGLGGVTSNPSIFEKAIAGSNDYDEALEQLIDEGKSVQEIYEALAVADIQTAADQLRPVYDRTSGADGFVSLEVNPDLAHDTAGTIAEAKRLYQTVNRPNVMIKVPATPAGIPAIAALIGVGINVNVTLIFSIASYREVMNAYLEGLETLAANGPSLPGAHGVARVASVASFFVSRVDNAVDKRLEEAGNRDLQGKIAVANSKAAYLAFEETFRGGRWEALAARGARVQRPLWASTSTKNPAYPDTLYVDTLIGPHTVNTLPPATLDSFLDHGVVANTIKSDMQTALDQLVQLEALGIDLAAVTAQLQEEGVAAFAKSFHDMMKSIAGKRHHLLAARQQYHLRLGSYEPAVKDALSQLKAADIPARIWAHDHTVWREDPAEISNRLGWLHSSEVMRPAIADIEALVAEVRSAGYTHALLLGMGGSSLAPEVFRKVFGVREGYLDLTVLDSTDPGAVLEKTRQLDPAKTLYIVSTKSGGTVETLSFAKYFYTRVVEALGPEQAGAHFLAITDPGSGLEQFARELGFRKIFLNDPDIGGRYSALSYFGSVPAALLGIDLARLYDQADVAAEDARNPFGSACTLGAVMGVLALQGRDKMTLVASPAVAPFGAWVEQLVAESTGKAGKGIVPVDQEALLAPDKYARDRLFVHLRFAGENGQDQALAQLAEAGHPVMQFDLNDRYQLGGEFFRWEIATVIAGRLLGINPFDQPDVESAKIVAREMMSAYRESGTLPDPEAVLEAEGMRVFADFKPGSLSDALSRFLGQAAFGENSGKGRSYIALQAYVQPTEETDAALQQLRTRIQAHYRMATTVGYGPRFLHSTGQLHKGDGGKGLFIQLTADMPEDAQIPDKPGESGGAISFAVLKAAQALGDRQALLNKQRQVLRIHLGKQVAAGIKHLTELVR